MKAAEWAYNEPLVGDTMCPLNDLYTAFETMVMAKVQVFSQNSHYWYCRFLVGMLTPHDVKANETETKGLSVDVIFQ